MFCMRAHFGWIHYLLGRIGAKFPPIARLFRWVDARLVRRSDLRAIAFDRRHATDTFSRCFVSCTPACSPQEVVWGYGPVNPDFFREILRSVHLPYGELDFVDIGCGKGAALMLASEFGFKRIIGVDLAADLLSIAHSNAEKYRHSTGRSFFPELVHSDIMEWPIPTRDVLFFLNNPFPEELSLRVLGRLQNALEQSPGRAILIYRKAPGSVGDHLHLSPTWRALRLTPYWRIYASVPMAQALASGARGKPNWALGSDPEATPADSGAAMAR